MSPEANHISVCICTYKRPALLKQLLEKLEGQVTDGSFSYSVVIADNDSGQSARQCVSDFAAESLMEIRYCVEPRQNIALARNKAVENARGDAIALIDDDEIPEDDWLFRLWKMHQAAQADGVLGPVKPRFEHRPPAWVVKGNIFERPAYPTGYALNWPQTRSGNVLFKRNILSWRESPFRAEFGTGGEDIDFFRRMIGRGKKFIWCQEAIVHEIVPPSRCRRFYQVKRALLRGGNSLKFQAYRPRIIVDSFVAMPVYALALPVLFLFGDHLFMEYLIKLCDHAGRLMKLIGLMTVSRREM